MFGGMIFVIPLLIYEISAQLVKDSFFFPLTKLRSIVTVSIFT